MGDKFRNACMNTRPCMCNAPIAYTSIIDDIGHVHVTLFSIDDDMNTNEIYSTHTLDDDNDDLNMICTKCGVNWVSHNPIFDY